MKKKLIFGFGVLVLLASFVASLGSPQVFASGNPMPPCPPTGCTLPPAR